MKSLNFKICSGLLGRRFIYRNAESADRSVEAVQTLSVSEDQVSSEMNDLVTQLSKSESGLEDQKIDPKVLTDVAAAQRFYGETLALLGHGHNAEAFEKQSKDSLDDLADVLADQILDPKEVAVLDMAIVGIINLGIQARYEAHANKTLSQEGDTTNAFSVLVRHNSGLGKSALLGAESHQGEAMVDLSHNIDYIMATFEEMGLHSKSLHAFLAEMKNEVMKSGDLRNMVSANFGRSLVSLRQTADEIRDVFNAVKSGSFLSAGREAMDAIVHVQILPLHIMNVARNVVGRSAELAAEAVKEVSAYFLAEEGIGAYSEHDGKLVAVLKGLQVKDQSMFGLKFTDQLFDSGMDAARETVQIGKGFVDGFSDAAATAIKLVTIPEELISDMVSHVGHALHGEIAEQLKGVLKDPKVMTYVLSYITGVVVGGNMVGVPVLHHVVHMLKGLGVGAEVVQAAGKILHTVEKGLGNTKKIVKPMEASKVVHGSLGVEKV